MWTGTTREGSLHRRRLWLLAPSAALLLGGCAERRTLRVDDPTIQHFLEVVLPRAVEVRQFTRFVSFRPDAKPDGVEVIVEAVDAFGDPVKTTGRLNIELHRLRVASADRLGERVALWTVNIDDATQLRTYWDRLGRFYRLPLQLESGPLEPGGYVITAQLISPAKENLFAELEIAAEEKAAVLPRGG